MELHVYMTATSTIVLRIGATYVRALCVILSGLRCKLRYVAFCASRRSSEAEGRLCWRSSYVAKNENFLSAAWGCAQLQRSVQYYRLPACAPSASGTVIPCVALRRQRRRAVCEDRLAVPQMESELNIPTTTISPGILKLFCWATARWARAS